MPVRAKAIIPNKRLAEPARIIRACENALDGAALAAKADFGVTTRTWSERSKPDFEISRGKLLREILISGDIYGFVNDGTAPHRITAAPGKFLAFRVPYVAKTNPRVIASGPGNVGGTLVFAQVVNHPGNAAREFDKEIAQKWEKELPDILQRAIDSEV